MSTPFTQLEGEVYDGGITADSNSRKISLTRHRATRVSQASGAGYENSARGITFAGCSAVAGVAPGTALATTAQALILYNPVGSNINMSLKRLSWSYVSGTFGLGMWHLARYSTLSPSTNVAPGGTAIVTARTDGTVIAGKVLAWAAATCTAAPIKHQPLGWVGVIDGTGATQLGHQGVYNFDGSDVCIPGTGLVFTFIGGAGTSPLVVPGALWDEIPVSA
jgi:hypothetical protein